MQPTAPIRPAYKLGIALAALAAIVAAATARDPKWAMMFGVAPDTSDYVSGFTIGVLLAAALVVLVKARMMPAGSSGDLPVDVYHTQQRRMLVSVSALIAAFGGLAIIDPLRHGGTPEIDFSIEFALIAMAGAAAVTFGVGFVRSRYRAASNDEFVKALRLRSVQLGYLIAVMGTATICIANLFWPHVTAVGLPVTLLAAVLGPCIYFLIAERQASAED